MRLQFRQGGQTMPLSRREIVGTALVGPLLASLPGLALADGQGVSAEMRRALEARRGWPTALWLRRLNGEEVFADFRQPDGAWLPAGLVTLSWAMRDYRSGAAVEINRALFELLSRLQAGLSQIHGSAVPLVLQSGFRTPESNANTEGAARNSMHLMGQAADIKVPDFAPNAVAAAAAVVAGGGIGIYPTFTHVDVARPRFWRGEARKGS
ncbi:DUF882 domain-containing protein [Xanthobacter sp. DSM 14520]|uniref:YcbK family protein n=1 Tax=Xanthobacter autotrophicus (strain ATCC BAA-1158 / Py2) TaxID=78245 RepID=UPI00372B74F8